MDLIIQKQALVTDWKEFVQERGIVGPACRIAYLRCDFDAFQAERRFQIMQRQENHGTHNVQVETPFLQSLHPDYPSWTRQVKMFRIFDWSHRPRAPEFMVLYTSVALYEHTFRYLAKEVRKSCHRDKNNYWLNIANDLQTKIEEGNFRDAYRLTRKLCSPPKRHPAALIEDAQGNPVLSPEERIFVWTDYYNRLLNNSVLPEHLTLRFRSSIWLQDASPEDLEEFERSWDTDEGPILPPGWTDSTTRKPSSHFRDHNGRSKNCF